jgi:DNA primase
MMASIELHKAIEEIKAKVDFVGVCESTGFRMGKGRRGKYIYGLPSNQGGPGDSFAVDEDWGVYTWFSKMGEGSKSFETGDVFTFLERYGKMDFGQALEHLAKMTGVDLPERKMTAEQVQAFKAIQERVQIFGIAQVWMVKNLRENAAALDYAHSRGWNDKTIEAEGIGFVDPRLKGDLRGEMQLYNIDLQRPDVAALIGFEGDVTGWGSKWGVNLTGVWIENGRIPGLVDWHPGLVYPHRRRGEVVYFSKRNLAWEADRLVNFNEPKSYNLPKELVGEREVFYNRVYRKRSERAVLVEGQGDAISLGQWGIEAAALVGVAANEGLMETLRPMGSGVQIYVATDADEVGKRASRQVARLAGPLCRVVDYPQARDGDKDANDWLKSMIEVGLSQEEQTERAEALLNAAPTLLEVVAGEASEAEGTTFDKLRIEATALLDRIPEADLGFWCRQVAKKLRDSASNLQRKVEKAQKKAAKEAEQQGEPMEFLGGTVFDHFVELVYLPETYELRYAVRYPDGRMDLEKGLKIEGVFYTPGMPDTMVKKNVVLLPTAFLKELPSTAEILGRVRRFIHRYVDVDEFYENLATYYVLFSSLYDCFTVLPYLRALGDYGTGKTRLIQTVGTICYRPSFTSGASTTSPIFRMLDRYHGTLILDEADFGRSDEAADIIKILNCGYMRGMPVLRTVDRGDHKFDVEAFEVYGPKVIATRKQFGDRALESRCLTKEMGGGVPRVEIPVVLPKEFWFEAADIRNMLLRYRMEFWKGDREVDYNQMDRAIEPRLNQVTVALKMLVQEPGMMKHIDEFIREYNRQIVVERSLTMTAKALQALVEVGKEKMVQEGGELFLKDVAERVNFLIDQQNKAMGDETEDEMQPMEEGKKGKRGGRITSRRVSEIVRKYLQMRTDRWTQGEHKGLYYVIWDGEKMGALCGRYGINLAEVQARKSEVVDLNGVSFAGEREKWKQAGLGEGVNGLETDKRITDGEGPEPWDGMDETEMERYEGMASTEAEDDK